MVLVQGKRRLLERLNHDGVTSALASDQHGALKRMMTGYQTEEPSVKQVERLKTLVSGELTPYASSILLDPGYGLPASKVRDVNAGLLLAYEKTGYDAAATSHLPDCLVEWSTERLKKEGVDAVKFLLYYDVNGDEYVNLQKQTYIERVGAECKAENMSSSLEILAYDENIADNTNTAFAKVKPRKTNETMEAFSSDHFGIDVLKVKVPINMKYVEGFADSEVVYTKEEAAKAFKDQEAVSHLPYICLSANVSAKLFQEMLVFAAESGTKFNDILCERATQADSIRVYIEEDEAAAYGQLRIQGRKDIEELNAVLTKTTDSWSEKV